jgi:methanogenic corrinoid protein MtbC1
MLIEVGRAWSRGDIEVRHEHFCSEVLEDVLRTLRTPLESGARGRPVVLACLPDESHSLGLQIAALAVTAAGRKIRLLGPDTPVDGIVQTALELNAPAVGLSISNYAVNEETSVAVASVRGGLPQEIRIWLGGAGSSDLAGLPVNVEVLDGLAGLEREVRRLED